ncbi:hypothetical protein NP233_g8963 [Leucocoprinus birnbaumii]|uniref:F-box domain-containing protein n=1 Tax=Leucocoprinus birnbaumii TaxID=56174 RepID=A0AAD5YTC7_9AGAR|nr:hypothetical protein NP233_g8963 [Leucocoprinus birnbaumii]
MMACLNCRLRTEAILCVCVCQTREICKTEEKYSCRTSVSLLGSGSEQTRPDFNAHDLLRTNYHPVSASDLSRIHSSLDLAQKSLAYLDSDIAHVEQVLSNLLTKRQSLHRSIASQRSLLSPIRRLPNELLSEIFLSRAPFCGNGDGDVGLSASFTDLQTDSLWTITQVCSLWRTVAQWTPCLWNTLLIDLSSLKGKTRAYNNLFTRLSTCLENIRPTALPLNFAIIGTHFQDSAHLLPLIEALCTHADRWSKVYFCPYTTNILASSNLDPKFRNLSSTPQLSAIGLWSFSPTPGFIQTPTRFAHAPNMRKLAIYDYRSLPSSFRRASFTFAVLRQPNNPSLSRFVSLLRIPRDLFIPSPPRVPGDSEQVSAVDTSS